MTNSRATRHAPTKDNKTKKKGNREGGERRCSGVWLKASQRLFYIDVVHTKRSRDGRRGETEPVLLCSISKVRQLLLGSSVSTFEKAPFIRRRKLNEKKRKTRKNVEWRNRKEERGYCLNELS